MARRKNDNAAEWQAYFDSISHFPRLTAEEEAELAERVSQGDLEARERFTESNLRLVIFVAKNYTGRGVSIEDLISEGNLGLMRAVEGYKPSENATFSTYATPWIRQSISKLIRTKSQMVRVRMKRTTLAQWSKAKAELAAKLGRDPGIDEIGKHLKLSNRQVKLIVQAMIVIQLQSNMNPGGDDEADLGGIVADTSSTSVGDAIEDAEILGRLPTLIAGLTDEERTVIGMTFGLDGYPLAKQKEIADAIGYHRQSVAIIKNRALAKLAAALIGREGGP